MQAQTPDSPGDYAYNAIQTYEDGSEVEWTGAPDSEEPAPVVTVAEGGAEDHSGGIAEASTTAGVPQTETSQKPVAAGDLPQTGGPVSPLLGVAAGSFPAGLATAAPIIRRRRSEGAA